MFYFDFKLYQNLLGGRAHLGPAWPPAGFKGQGTITQGGRGEGDGGNGT